MFQVSTENKTADLRQEVNSSLPTKKAIKFMEAMRWESEKKTKNAWSEKKNKDKQTGRKEGRNEGRRGKKERKESGELDFVCGIKKKK